MGKGFENRSGIRKAQNNLGIALVKSGKVPDGIAHLERAVQLKPEYAEAHSNLGKALSLAGRPDEAMAHWQRLWSFIRTLPMPMRLSASAWREKEGWKRRLRTGEKPSRLTPN